MEYLQGKVSLFKALWLRWRSLKYIPFRKKFFIGYDLKGNTYWEFFLENKNDRRRRIIEYREKRHHSEQDIPPQCIMWLRRTRPDFPTLQELVGDIQRQQRMKILAQLADERWKKGSLLQNPGLTPEQQQKLNAITGGLHENSMNTREEDKTLVLEQQHESQKYQKKAKSPFDSAGESPIQHAAVKPRRR